jgi:hypothetical protein
MDKHKKWNFFFVKKGKMRKKKEKNFKMASCFEIAVISMQIQYFWEYCM